MDLPSSSTAPPPRLFRPDKIGKAALLSNLPISLTVIFSTNDCITLPEEETPIDREKDKTRREPHHQEQADPSSSKRNDHLMRTCLFRLLHEIETTPFPLLQLSSSNPIRPLILPLLPLISLSPGLHLTFPVRFTASPHINSCHAIHLFIHTYIHT